MLMIGHIFSLRGIIPRISIDVIACMYVYIVMKGSELVLTLALLFLWRLFLFVDFRLVALLEYRYQYLIDLVLIDSCRVDVIANHIKHVFVQ